MADVSAQAATPGIQIDVLHGGNVVTEGTEIPEGSTITLRVQYDADEPIDGKQITFTLPGEITVAGALPNNDAIESPITWKIGDEEMTVKVIVKDSVTPPTPVTNTYNKSVNPSNLDGFVQTSGSPNYNFLGINPAITNETLTYTLVLGSNEARSNYSIVDTLTAGLGFVPGTFAATLTTPTGTVPFTFSPSIAGNSFTGSVTVPEQSTLRITYDVRVTDVAALTALLQQKFNDRAGTPGDYQIQLPNAAVFGGDIDSTVNVRLRGNIPGVGIGTNFAKSGGWTLRDVITDESGTLQPAAEMTYTFRANLTPWDGRNANFTLGRNVVISDTLIDQAAWKTGAGFVTISGAGPITTLTQAASFTGTADRDHNAGVVVLPDNYEEGVNDHAAFNKTAVNGEVRVNPGERATVPYRFDIDTAKPNIDALTVRIVDDVDTDIFDVSDLDAIAVTGSYGSQGLTRADFTVSVDSDGKLVIELSTTGKTLIAAQPTGQRLSVLLELTTIAFDGKETFEIYNRASLFSDGFEWDYWSDDNSEATSYGDEAELRKRVFDADTSTWVSDLNALIDDGKFVNDRFVYAIELIPRGNYGQAFPVTIFTRQDILPDAVEFLGFVTLDSNGVPESVIASNDNADMNGNVLATYNDGIVTIQQRPGKSLTADQAQPIRFTVSSDGREELVDVVVTDELVSGTGTIQNLTCTFPDATTGTTWAGPFAIGEQFDCTGTLPALGAGQTHSDTAKVVAQGILSGKTVTDSDNWHGFTPASAVENNEDDKTDEPKDNQTSPDGDDKDELPVTGSGPVLWLGLAGMTLLTAGGGLLFIRRNRILQG